MSNTDFLGRAIDVVKKAIENDTAGEYEKAYQLYYQARETQIFFIIDFPCQVQCLKRVLLTVSVFSGVIYASAEMYVA